MIYMRFSRVSLLFDDKDLIFLMSKLENLVLDNKKFIFLNVQKFMR
jgi:hypothetical protein